MRSFCLSPFPLPSDPKKKRHIIIVRYYFVSVVLSSGSASVLGVYGIFGFCLVVSNYTFSRLGCVERKLREFRVHWLMLYDY